MLGGARVGRCWIDRSPLAKPTLHLDPRPDGRNQKRASTPTEKILNLGFIYRFACNTIIVIANFSNFIINISCLFINISGFFINTNCHFINIRHLFVMIIFFVVVVDSCCCSSRCNLS